jgi:hypothetical protein
MSTLFGQRIEPDFDLAKQKRQDRVNWALLGGTILALLYLFSGGRFSTELFQGLFATILPYGASFYVNQMKNLRRLWLWKAIFASCAVHALYLIGIFSADRVLPHVMTKAIFFVPILAVGFVIESFIFDQIVQWFRPHTAIQS